jgi:hypothetical protein
MDPSASADFGDLEGYIAARILTLALGKIQGLPTREAVVDALEGLGQFDLGLAEPLHLSRTEHLRNQMNLPLKPIRNPVKSSSFWRRTTGPINEFPMPSYISSAMRQIS